MGIVKDTCFLKSGYKFRNCVVPSGVKAEVFIKRERCLDIVLRDW